MKKDQIGKRSLRWAIVMATIAAAVSLAWMMFGQTPAAAPSAVGSTGVFTPAHSSIGQSVRHFFNIRPTPVQPIEYTHTVHVNKVKMECVNCHVGVDKGPQASIPGVKKCWECHEYVPGESPAAQAEIKKIADYQKKGEDIPWQRVYGWPEESHVRFNHSPHIAKKVECAACHGDVPQMTVARNVVNHTMGFCVKCHEQRKVSNDCMTCHY